MLRKYTWILKDDFDPAKTILTDTELEDWIDAAEAYIQAHQGARLDIRVRVAQGSDAQGLFRGHYPDTHGLAGLDDDLAIEMTDRAFAHAWERMG